MKNLFGKFTFLVLILFCLTDIFGQSTFTVSNTNNDGNGSIAQAIIDANNNNGADIIEFDISGNGPHTIKLSSALPDIDDEVTIRGYSELGAEEATDTSIAKLMIEIDGINAGADVFGLVILTDNCTIEGLAITNFGQGGIFLGGDNNVIRGNHIGISIDGAEAKGNGFRSSDDTYYDGIWIDGSENLIGGILVGDRNVISCNAYSNIYMYGEATNNNKIQGNIIGPDATGTIMLDNQTDGIWVETGSNNTIGGTENGAGNLISGNDYSGIYFESEDGPSTIQGNFIGTDITGTKPLGNGSVGVGIISGSKYLIGGTDPNEANLISGNGYNDETGGLGLITGSNENTVIGNMFGTDLTGISAIPNYLYGIFINESEKNIIGNSEQSSRNLISGNELLGILVSNSQENIIKGNIIGLDISGTKKLANGESGIDLFSSSNNIIGGNNTEDKNIISGNEFEGIIIGSPNSNSNKIMGNYIGLAFDGETIIPNINNGIGIYAGSDNIIGGTLSGEGNVIAGNGENGIFIKDESAVLSLEKRSENINLTRINYNERTKKHIGEKSSKQIYFGRTSKISNLRKTTQALSDSGYSNSILGNSIYENSKLGIDLVNIERENDTNDSDNGPNAGQNHPEIQSVEIEESNFNLSYLVNSSISNSTYPLRIEFFIADTNGQGKTFIGSDVYTSAYANNTKTLLVAINTAIDTSMKLVATATDSLGNTSEFSEPVNPTIIVGIENIEKLPAEFSLAQNYPNPFNPTTIIKYTIPKSEKYSNTVINLKVYDVLGNEVATLVNQNQAAGNYAVNFNSSNLSSGIYYYSLKSGSVSLTKKMIVLK